MLQPILITKSVRIALIKVSFVFFMSQKYKENSERPKEKC